MGRKRVKSNFGSFFISPCLSRQYFALVIFIALCQYIDMVCVYCGGDTRVVNSRPQIRSNQIWRRRLCKSCQAIFSTIESHDPAQTWMVKKPGKPAKEFAKEKLFLSIYESLKHRSTALYDAKHLTQTVINNLSRTTKDGIIESRTITNTVIVSLNRFDKTASTHYRAFHAI